MRDDPTLRLLKAAILIYRTRPSDAASFCRQAADGLDGRAPVPPMTRAAELEEAPVTLRAIEYARAWTWFTSAELRTACGVEGRWEMYAITRALRGLGLRESVIRIGETALRIWRRPGQPQSEYTGKPVRWTPLS